MKLEEIIKIVEEETKYNLVDRNRKREIVYSRAIYYKLARVHTRESLSSIAKKVKRDHATALHGLKVFDEQISVYKDAIEYLKVYDKLDSLIRRSTNTREKDINPGPYYRNKFANALLELREERKTNRLLKEQLRINS